MSAEIINKLKRRLVKRKTKSARILMNGAGIFLKIEKKKQQYGHKQYKHLSEHEKKAG